MIIESFPGDAKPYKCNDCDTIFLWRDDVVENAKGTCIMMTVNEYAVNKKGCVINDGSCIFFNKCNGPVCLVCRSRYVRKINAIHYRIARYFRKSQRQGDA